jgi:hypothetical protein
MDLEFSKYPTPGVYVEETYTGVFTQAAQEATINFVPGFSRKGVFNRPVLIRTSVDRERIYGPLDRTLEAKGSFFHRTIDTLLQTCPVWGLNLLATNADDKLTFRSVSLSPGFENSAEVEMPYQSVFDRSGFWQPNTDLFAAAANANNTSDNALDKVLHLTNISDKKISVFIVKSANPAFNVPAELWYGSREKVPTYINPLALISDFAVRVVVVAGDWSAYKTLANDTRWSRYFNLTGLRKGSLDTFISDKQVTTLLDRQASLIPYFKDAQGNNLFIESVVNLASDTSGLYCAFDTDKFETDRPNGYVDLVGNSLVDSDQARISYMSYDDTILEVDTFETTYLDRAGNTGGVGAVGNYTSNNTIGSVVGLTVDAAQFSSGHVVINAADNAGVNFGGVFAPVTAGVHTLQRTPISSNGSNAYRVEVVYADALGNLNVLPGQVLTSGNSYPTVAAFVDAHPEYVLPASYPNSAIVLFSYLAYSSGGSEQLTPEYISINAQGFIPLTLGTSGTDIVVNTDTSGANVLTLTFVGTASVQKSAYAVWRRKQYYDALVAGKNLLKSVVIDATSKKWLLNNNFGWTTSADGDKSITITAPVGCDLRNPAAAGRFNFYFVDDEFAVGTSGTTSSAAMRTATIGGMGRYSAFAQAFYNGGIKTGDFFYERIAANVAAVFMKDLDGNDVVQLTATDANTLSSINAGSLLWLSNTTANNGKFTVLSVLSSTSTSITLHVSEAVTEASDSSVTVSDYAAKQYLKMFSVNGDVTCMFTDKAYNASALTYGPQGFDTYSDEQGYEQTVELELPDGYDVFDTRVLVQSARYPEVAVGNYLRAYVDETALEVGEEPRRLTRILSKRPWVGNVAGGIAYSEILTDAKIYRDAFVDSTGKVTYQTTRYTNVDDYIDTYKPMVLGGFQVHPESIPDGTDVRQNKILNVLASGTSMFNAICNKDRFSFRYLVDSFGLGLTELSKQQLADICGKRKNALGFISAPSMKQFRKSSNPSFVDAEGALNTAYIAAGANLEANPAFLYRLAVGDGATCVGYFAPYATVNDNGRPISVPIAPYVANTYMRKNSSRSSGILPWTIAAGVENGMVSGIANVEYDFTDIDVANMEAVGINLVVYKRNKGYSIETENTAEQSPKTSLSYIHSREVLIELENDLYAMLLPYKWKFNVAAIRAEIKRKADAICGRYVEQNGLYAYRNICDETNNTAAVIDNQFGLLETYVEIVKGMGFIVNYINVLPTNTINGTQSFSSSGFATT